MSRYAKYQDLTIDVTDRGVGFGGKGLHQRHCSATHGSRAVSASTISR